jgi:hypothetical protein
VRHLQLGVSLFGLLLVSGCSTLEPSPESQSILEVVDAANTPTSAALRGCGIGEVAYCLNEVPGVQRCTCLDSEQLSRASGGLFGR